MNSTEAVRSLLVPNEFSKCNIILETNNERLSIEHVGYNLNNEIEITVGLGETETAQEIDKIIMKMTENEEITKVFNLAECETFEIKIHLLKFREASYIYKLNVEDKIKRAEDFKEAASRAYRQNEFKAAFYLFSRSIKYLKICEVELKAEENDKNDQKSSEKLDKIPEINPQHIQLTQQISTLKQSCHLNLALCQCHGSNSQGTISNCSTVLSTQPTNVKALYHRGLAYMARKEFQLAIDDFNNAITHQPGK